jgi:hypothetical protein
MTGNQTIRSRLLRCNQPIYRCLLEFQEHFMVRPYRRLVLAALAVALTTAVAAAQQTAPVPPADVPGKPAATSTSSADSASETWDRTKAMSRREWKVAKQKWAQQKVKWRDCNRKADGERLKAPKSWSFIASCMTAS